MNLALQHSHTPSTGILFSRFTILNLRFAMPQVPTSGPDKVLFSAWRSEKATVKPPPRAKWLRVLSTLLARCAFGRSS